MLLHFIIIFQAFSQLREQTEIHHNRTRVYAPNYTLFKSADSLGKYVATINSPQLLSDFVILEYKQ